MNDQQHLRHLPAIDSILHDARLAKLSERLSPEILTNCAREAVAALRTKWSVAAPSQLSKAAALDAGVAGTLAVAEQLLSPSLRRVINATGIILHTGLGRARLSGDAQAMLREIIGGDCNLELDLQTGKRGDRHLHVEKLITQLTGAEAACVVNNNAAAVLLCLNTIAEGRHIITSRGQLVEIGGSFRMPEVVKKSGATLVEVGTTNKTKLRDYGDAITPQTAGILVAHTSNYRILGFTQEVDLRDLVKLADEQGLVLVDDLGGGIIYDLRRWGLPQEPVVADHIDAGAHLVTFSGDKVLGGPQCGLIAGKQTLIAKIKKNPLLRALRCDKVTLALLESTLRLFLHPDTLPQRHAVFRMLTEDSATVEARAHALLNALQAAGTEKLRAVVQRSQAEAGSGTLPLEKLPSWAVSLQPVSISAEELARRLRLARVPVIGYVRNDAVWLDARTVQDEDLTTIVAMVGEALGS